MARKRRPFTHANFNSARDISKFLGAINGVTIRTGAATRIECAKVSIDTMVAMKDWRSAFWSVAPRNRQTESINALFADRKKLERMPVQEFVAGLVLRN